VIHDHFAQLATIDRPCEDGTVHVTCCADEDVALCGADVAGHAEVAASVPTDCVVCAELDESSGCSGCPLTARQEAA